MNFKVPSVLRIDAMGTGHADQLKTAQGFFLVPQIRKGQASSSHRGPQPLEGPENILPEEVAWCAGRDTGFHATQAWV